MWEDKISSHVPKLISKEECKTAAVTIALQDKEGEDHVIFEVRSRKLRKQPGDICFPGGMAIKGEAPKKAALRELEEELLIREHQYKYLGAADYLMTANLMIYPFVVRLLDYENTYQTDEVEEVFTVPLSFFLQEEPEVYETRARVKMPESFPIDRIFRGEKYPWKERKEKVYFYQYKDRCIWGITAKLLYYFVESLKNE